MADYSRYDIDIDKYHKLIPDYLRTPGSIIMNQIQLFYDIINNYKGHMIDIWEHFSIDKLQSDYILWKTANPASDDIEWRYTDLVEKLCKTYDIIREHPVGILSNKHMLRLLKIKIMGVGFDGTREKLEEILNSLFGELSSVKYLVQTRNSEHASANVFIVKSLNDISFDITDESLFEGGYYFLELLGITLFYTVIQSDTLVYDYTNYDDGKKYDEGVTE